VRKAIETSCPDEERGLAYSWYALTLLSLVYAIHALDRTVINVLIEPIRVEFGVSDSALGFLTGAAHSLPFALAALPIGALIDRVRRDRLLAGLVFTWSAMTGLGGLCGTFSLLLLSRAAVGASEAGTQPLSLALIADLFRAALRPVASSVLYAGGYIGSLVGLYAAAAITAAHGWRVALFAAGLPGLLASMLVMLTLRDPRRGAKASAQATDAPPLADSFRLFRRHRAIALLVTAQVMGSVATMGSSTWMPALLLRSYHIPMREVGFVSALASLCGVLGSLLGGLAGHYLAKGRTERLLLICGISNICWIPALLAVTLETHGDFQLVWFLAAALIGPIYIGPAFSLASSLVLPDLRGRTLAIISILCNLIGAGIGPQLVGAVSDILHHLGRTDALPLAISTMGIAALASGLLFLLTRRVVPHGLPSPLE